MEEIEYIGGDFDDFSDYIIWAILICPQKKSWIISRVKKGMEVGNYEIDMSRNEEDWIIAALFDSNVNRALDAINVLGGGSIEGNSVVGDLLFGVCRAFVESQENLKKWIEHPPQS